MAKMNNAVVNSEATEVVAMEATRPASFIDVIGERPQPSLKAIADIMNVPPQRIYSVAKQPIAGQVYDARVYNWGAIGKFIEKRIGHAGDTYMNFEEVYEAAIAKDEEYSTSDKRKGPRGTTKVMIDLGDGKQIPGRRKEVKVGDAVKLKKYDGEFAIVYMTDTHVVLKQGESPILNCLSNWTFNQQVSEVIATPIDKEAVTEE